MHLVIVKVQQEVEGLLIGSLLRPEFGKHRLVKCLFQLQPESVTELLILVIPVELEPNFGIYFWMHKLISDNVLDGTHLVVILIHTTHELEGGHELTKLVVGQGDGIAETLENFAVLSKEIPDKNLLVVFSPQTATLGSF